MLSYVKTHVFSACGVPPAVPNLDMNISVIGEFIPGTVLHFKCNSTSTSKLDRHRHIERVTMLCLDNNTWTIRGAENCKPGKRNYKFSKFLWSSSQECYQLLNLFLSMYNCYYSENKYNVFNVNFVCQSI